ncbi:MAG: endo-beta-N-acetylglucosaminidase, partial [Bacteroidaceae bacterium]
QVGEQSLGNADGIYGSTWIVSMDRSWNNLNNSEDAKRGGVCLWGEHGQSRFMSYNVGATNMEFQSNYQKLLERGFSGGNRNPANLPTMSNTGNNWEKTPEGKEPLSTFGGIATYIPERTAIQGSLPFCTYFSLGNGERYNYKGKKTFGNWYNMGAQDVVPTYRWLVYNAGTKVVSTEIQPAFTHEDAYIGGSALQLAGKSSAQGTDVVLYRTKLTIANASPIVKIAVKSRITGNEPSRLFVILKKLDNDQWIEFPVGNTAGTTWQEKEIALSGMATNDVIEYIGLRVKGDYAGNYNMLVGKLELNDNNIATPASIKANSLKVEVKEETNLSLSVKLNWAVDATGLKSSHADWNMLYNDEANIDHFEIMYKNGTDGKITEVARTTTWSGFAGNILFKGASDEPYIGVRAASTDLKTYSPVQWVKVERSTSPDIPVLKDNSYCKSEVNPAAEGVDIARKSRYLEIV